jgi:hypothetical protein
MSMPLERSPPLSPGDGVAIKGEPSAAIYNGAGLFKTRVRLWDYWTTVWKSLSSIR